MSKDSVTQRGIRETGNHSDLSGGHDFSRLDSENGEAKDAITHAVNESFHKTPGLGKRSGSQYRDERNFRQAIGNASLFGLRFAQTNPGKLGIGEHAEGHLTPGGYAMAPQDIF